MATIKQIASLAGVSRGTVDRVLNNRGTVNPETAAKVLEIAEAVQYTPNKVGKSLAVRKKHLRIGFILFSSNTSNPFFDDVLAGVEAKREELQDLGIGVEVHFCSFGSHQSQVLKLEELAQDGINAIAITPNNHPAVAAKIRELMGKGIPVVTVNSDIENSGRLAYVGSNYYKSGKTAGGLMGLITGGKANVGIVTGSDDVLCHTERISGFKRNLQKYHPCIQIVDVVYNNDDDFESFAVTKQLLTEHPETDALYLTAAGVYGACRAVQSLGLAGKLKIISFDTVPTTKKLVKDGVIAATIDQQPAKQGAKPLDILSDYLAMDQKPQYDCFYTSVEVKIRENI